MLRTLTHYWPVNLAVVLGAAVTTAVLTGALVVGDSVRGSLRELTLDRLGGIDSALVSARFFREELADEVPGAVAAVVARGSALRPDSGARASQVGIHGIDDRFTSLFGDGLPLSFEREAGQIFPSVIINEALRRELGADVGGAIVLYFGHWSDVPRDTLMGDSDPEAVLGSMRLTVKQVLPDRGVGRFGLIPSQQTPLNAFVALKQLQRAVDVRGQVNALFLGASPGDPDVALESALVLEDFGLVLENRGEFLHLESPEFVLRPEVDLAVGEVAGELDATLQRTQSYLSNKLVRGDRLLPYSLVTALDPRPEPSWAALKLTSGGPARGPSGDGILLSTWAARDLGAAVGDTVDMTYFVVGPREELIEAETRFRVEGIVSMTGLGADRTLTPDYPGIQEARDMTAWDPPFPVELALIRDEDEAYWDEFGATPKAFVAEETGRRLWSTRYGSTTAARLGPPAGTDVAAFEQSFSEGLRRRLVPEAFGFGFRPVKEEGLRAAGGATDFAGLFIGFSMFLIFSAALLVGLLFRLGVEQRAGQIGLLLAVGHRVRSVRRRLQAEGTVLAGIGGLLGLAGGVGYAGLMMAGLRTWWRPAVGSSELFLHVQPVSLVLGWAIGVIVVFVSVTLSVRKLVRVPPPRLLAGAVRDVVKGKRRRITPLLAFGGLLGAIATVGTAFATGNVSSPGLAFGTGSMLLTSGMAFFALWCRGSQRRRLRTRIALVGMASRNSAWNPGRSILSVCLVASASFVIVIVAANFAEGGEGLESRESGSGGFSLVAESDVPLYQDLNRDRGRFALGFSEADSERLAGTEVYPFRLLPGDDASCLNLYQPEKPRVLGAPASLVSRGGFAFSQHLELPAGEDNPWVLLEQDLGPGVIPAFGDENSVKWILHLGLGQDIEMENDQGETVRLRLVGLLKSSVFQSELLIAEQHFLNSFPGRAGESYFLIDAPDDPQAVAGILEKSLSDFGFDATTTREKIEAYSVVQNTYLSTFRALGGLGLLLGTIGLGVVLIRNVVERRGELATLRAFGFRRSVLAWLVLAENAFLLLVGLGIGTVSALAAAAPRLASVHVPWSSLLGTLGIVVAVGMLSSIAGVLGALRVPMLPALKAES